MQKPIIIAVGLALGLSAIAFSAPPDVTSLFPAGAQRGTSVSVTIQGKLGDGAGQAWVSRPDVTVTLPEKPGPITVAVSAHAEPGICWLRFYNSEGASALRPFIIGTYPEVNETEPNDDLPKAQAVSTLPVVINGQHGKNGDADSFAVPLQKGQVLVASLLANRVIGSPQDAVLQILGPHGFVLEQNEDDQGFDPQLAFTAPADGTYIVRTWAFPATPDSSIRLFGSPASVYRLLLTTGPFVDHVRPAAVQAGMPQRVKLLGWNLTDGDVEVTAPVSALNRRFELPLPGWNHRLPATVLAVPFATGVEQEPNPLANPQAIAAPIGVSGLIAQARDEDAYQFAAKKGQRLRFEVIARDAGSPLDPVLRLYDSSNKLLKEADDDGKQSADPDIEFTFPADGNYRVSIGDRFLHGGDRFAYLLLITEPQPDYSLTVAADAFSLTAGKELEIPVTVSRSNFAESIDVRVEGLPAGVSAAAVVSEPKGDSAKAVKLKLKADADVTYRGPIQVVGSAPPLPSDRRIATFPQKAFQSETSHLWLTIAKPR